MADNHPFFPAFAGNYHHIAFMSQLKRLLNRRAAINNFEKILAFDFWLFFLSNPPRKGK